MEKDIHIDMDMAKAFARMMPSSLVEERNGFVEVECFRKGKWNGSYEWYIIFIFQKDGKLASVMASTYQGEFNNVIDTIKTNRDDLSAFIRLTEYLDIEEVKSAAKRLKTSEKGY